MPAAPQFDKFKKYFSRKKPSIQEIVREPTVGRFQKDILKREKPLNKPLSVKLVRKQVSKMSMCSVGSAKSTSAIAESTN
jgi:hypothetical protein